MKKNGLAENLFWKFFERISAQTVSLVVSVVLARLLSPTDYGVVAIVMIFITFANIFVSDGFGSALIQKKDATVLDYCSVLYFNIFFSIVLYFLLFFIAPLIANFYGEGYRILVPVLRVLALRLPLTAINSVQQAYVSKNMMFRKFFLSTLCGTIISGFVGIVMAYKDFGVWALVYQYLVSTSVNSVVLAIVIKKVPRFIFSFRSIKELFPFGARVLGVGLLSTGYQEVRALVIGKIYSSADLAYFDKGKQFPTLLMTNINVSISSVLFPKMANEQNDIGKLKETTRRSIRLSSYLVMPMLLGLAVVAEPFVSVVLTEKWLPCVPLLQASCLMYLFQPIHSANMQAIKASGRGDIYFWLEFAKKAVEIIVLICIVSISVKAIAISMAVCANVFTLFNAYPNKKLINYGFKEQMQDIFPNLAMSLFMMVCISPISFIHVSPLIKLVVQVFLGALIYLAVSICTQNKEFSIIKKIMLSKIKKER